VRHIVESGFRDTIRRLDGCRTATDRAADGWVGMSPPVLYAAGGRIGFIGEYLADLGGSRSLAGAAGSGVVLVVVSVLFYLGGVRLAVPVLDDILRRRGVDDHARKPVRVLCYAAVGVVGVGLGFALAGYGNILIALSTVGAAATLAVGFALQDVIKNVVAGVFVYTDRSGRATGSSGAETPALSRILAFG
jgi:small conductance mechanosensitive channel